MKAIKNKKTNTLACLHMSDYGLFVDITDGDPPTIFEDSLTFNSLVNGCGLALTKLLKTDYELVSIEIKII